VRVVTYTEVEDTLRALVTLRMPDWSITDISYTTAKTELEKYEKEGRPPPKLFIEDEGVTFTWEVGGFKIYQHFPAETSESEYYVYYNGRE
jgi:hypothetical protein